MIEIKEVSKTYHQGKISTKALSEVSFVVNKKESLGIVGESGSGKSTLLRLIQLMETPSTGDILIDGEPTSKWTEKQKQIQKRKMSMLFQSFNLLSNLTVLDNVILPLKLQQRKDLDKALELLEFVGLSEQKKSYPSQLSGGQKQRVALARSLITNPEILLLDEATSALDDRTTEEILVLLEKVKKSYEPTIVFVSHDLDVIKSSCERVLIIEKGKIVNEARVNQKKVNSMSESYSEKAMRVLSL